MNFHLISYFISTLIFIFQQPLLANGYEITSCEELNDILQETDLKPYYPLQVDLGFQDCTVSSIGPDSVFARNVVIDRLKAKSLSFVTDKIKKRAAGMPHRKLLIRNIEVDTLDLSFDPFTWQYIDNVWKLNHYTDDVYLHIREGQINRILSEGSTLIHIEISPNVELNYDERLNIERRKSSLVVEWQDNLRIQNSFLVPLVYPSGTYKDVHFKNVVFHEKIKLDEITLVRPVFNEISISSGAESWFFENEQFTKNLTRSDLYTLMQPVLQNSPRYRLSSLRDISLANKNLTGFSFSSQVIDLSATGASFENAILDQANLLGLKGELNPEMFNGSSFKAVTLCPNLANHLLSYQFNSQTAVWFLSFKLGIDATTCGASATNEKNSFQVAVSEKIKKVYKNSNEQARTAMLKESGNLNVANEFMTILGDLLPDANLLSVLAISRGIDIELSSASDRDLIKLFQLPAETRYQNFTVLQSKALANLRNEFQKIWTRYDQAAVTFGHEDLQQFVFALNETKFQDRLRNLKKILISLQTELEEHSKTSCLIDKIGLPVPYSCPHASADRALFQKHYQTLEDGIAPLNQTERLLSLANSSELFDTLGLNRLLKMVNDLKEKPYTTLDHRFEQTMIKLLELQFSKAIESRLRKDLVEITSGLRPESSALVAEFLNQASIQLETAKGLFEQRQKDLERQDGKSLACTEQKSLDATIQALAKGKQSSALQIDNNIAALLNQISELKSELNTNGGTMTRIKRLAEVWCSENLKREVTDGPRRIIYPENELHIARCKVFDFHKSENHYLIFGNINNWKDKRKLTYSIKAAYLNLYSEYSDLHIRNLRVTNQIQSMNLQVLKIKNTKKVDAEQFSSQILAQKARYELYKNLCAKNLDIGFTSDQLTELSKINLESVESGVKMAIEAMSFYRNLLNLDSDYSIIMPSLTTSPLQRIQSFQLILSDLVSDWEPLKTALFSQVDAGFEYRIIPIFPGFWSENDNRRAGERELFVKELQNIATWQKEDLKGFMSPDNIAACIAETIYQTMEKVDNSFNETIDFPKFSVDSERESFNWNLAADSLLQWKKMPEWYGSRMRATDDYTLRDNIRQAWALWKYHRTYDRFWRVFHTLNADEIPEAKQTQISFKLGADLFPHAESSFITGIYPASIINMESEAGGQIDAFLDEYKVSCTATGIHHGNQFISRCSENSATNFNYDQNGSFANYPYAAKLLTVHRQFNINRNTASYRRGIQLAADLRGRNPLFESFDLSIMSGDRRSGSKPFYAGTYLIISYLRNENLSVDTLINWNGDVAVPKIGSDQLMSDIYFPERDDVLFQDQSPLSWLLKKKENDSEVASCTALKQQIDFRGI